MDGLFARFPGCSQGVAVVPDNLSQCGPKLGSASEGFGGTSLAPTQRRVDAGPSEASASRFGRVVAYHVVA
jgi:hypothetical protein